MGRAGRQAYVWKGKRGMNYGYVSRKEGRKTSEEEEEEVKKGE